MSTSPTVPPSAGALVRLRGSDALALLHRISTAALDGLGPGQACATLFCDFRGRLLHRAVVAVTADGTVWLLRDDAPGGELAAFVDRSVFREDLRLDDAGAGHHVRSVAAPDGLASGALLERDGVPRLVRPAGPLALAVLDGAAAAADAADERARLAALRPRHGHEIAEAFTPFEVGLAHEVHLKKGCYTGQEALMRLVTYRSVRRRLVAVAGAGDAPATPSDLVHVGVRAGVLTSACAGGDGWVGLAVVAHEVATEGAGLATVAGAPLQVTRLAPATRPRGLPED